MTLKVIRLLQDLSVTIIDEYLCDISHGFKWHGASRGPSAIAEFLVDMFWAPKYRNGSHDPNHARPLGG